MQNKIQPELKGVAMDGAIGRKIEIEYRAVLGIISDARFSRKSFNSFIIEYLPAIFGMFTTSQKVIAIPSPPQYLECDDRPRYDRYSI